MVNRSNAPALSERRQFPQPSAADFYEATMAKGAKTKKVGRPKAKWKSKANAERIFEEMRGGLSLREICFRRGLPLAKVYEWLNGEEFRDNYADAQTQRADFFFDEIIKIADEVAEDKDAVAAARLKIDTRKWMMGRMCPKKYADKVNVDVNGALKETHDGKIDIAPTDSAIQGVNAILDAIIRAGKSDGVEDAGQK